MTEPLTLKNKLIQWYEKNEIKLQVAVFVFGFLLDYFTADETDLFTIIQQAVYLIAAAVILSFEHLEATQNLDFHSFKLKPISQRFWQYRGLFLHFILGSLLSLYSFFFLKSASVFNSMLFVLFLMALLVANELPVIQKSGLNIKWSLWVLCLFSFFIVLFPLIFGFVGWVPFLMAGALTGLCLYLHFRFMKKYHKHPAELVRSILRPGLVVVGIFIGLYFLRMIPPVPLAASELGIYHALEKSEGKFLLFHEKPWWKFWQQGDQDFRARPGDVIYFFAQIFSPARFSDEVLIHWLYKDPRAGWKTSDKVRMGITGGRKQGFRGFSFKKNYQPGEWQVRVETTDEREIGRLYFDVSLDTGSGDRVWVQDQF